MDGGRDDELFERLRRHPVPLRLATNFEKAPYIADEADIPKHANWLGVDLTPVETRVLTTLSHGMGARGAASLLGIGHETVRHHSKAARYKLRAKNTTHAVAIALRQGLIA